MSEPKFTPRPWTARHDPYDPGDVDNPCTTMIVDCGGFGEWHCTVTIEMRKTLEANSALIAAAPDLYAACAKLEKLGAVIATTGLGEELRAALAKARGEA